RGRPRRRQPRPRADGDGPRRGVRHHRRRGRAGRHHHRRPSLRSGELEAVMAERRVVVTGLGVLAACGIGRDAFWQGLLAPQAIGNAARAIFDGRCDAVVTGGSEAAMVEIGITGFANMTALSSVGVSRPFDAERDGFVMTEGAAVLILEERSIAEARGATIL